MHCLNFLHSWPLFIPKNVIMICISITIAPMFRFHGSLTQRQESLLKDAIVFQVHW